MERKYTNLDFEVLKLQNMQRLRRLWVVSVTGTQPCGQVGPAERPKKTSEDQGLIQPEDL